MSKETIRIISPNSIEAQTPDWQQGYEQGLLAGYTRSIVLVRHLQRTLSSHKDPIDWGGFKLSKPQREILDEAMELIADKIEPNKDE